MPKVCLQNGEKSNIQNYRHMVFILSKTSVKYFKIW